MQLKIGPFSFDADSVFVGRAITTLESEDEIPYGLDHTWTVNGDLIGSGQADLIAKQNALLAALSKPYQDLSFYADGGSLAFRLPNDTSANGVRITDLNLPGSLPGEFATRVAFSFVARAKYEYGPESLSTETLEFTETLTIRGGGPRFELVECVNALPVAWQVTPASVCRATQRGHLMSLVPRPAIPAPVWPEYLLEEPEVEYTSPAREGGRGYWRYGVSWAYQFGAPVRL